ncbi:hypothetical protein [Duganella sp. BuS-21]|uniref:hypothetical protein n=1 Tax=Duganella sp. BuS-21 TaxID=2943848 RepID=UPI0035A68125
MLARYKKIGNAAVGVSAVCFATILVLGKNSSTGNVWGPGGAPPILMYAEVMAIFGAFWAYAKSKGYAGWLGVVLLFLNVVGLIVLLKLRDKHPNISESNDASSLPPTKKLVLAIFIVVGLVAFAYVFTEIRKASS